MPGSTAISTQAERIKAMPVTRSLLWWAAASFILMEAIRGLSTQNGERIETDTISERKHTACRLREGSADVGISLVRNAD